MAHANRLNWRTEILLARNRNLIEGKKVLDLASHDGRFSYACVQLGAKSVTGVEGRQELVDFAKQNVPEGTFVCADLFNYLADAKPGDFDTILCFGVFYHTMRQDEMLAQFRRLSPDTVIIDTAVYSEGVMLKLGRQANRILKRLRGRPEEPRTFLSFRQEDPSIESNTIVNHGISAVPTRELCELLFGINGFDYQELTWNPSDWRHLDDYKEYRRTSYLLSSD